MHTDMIFCTHIKIYKKLCIIIIIIKKKHLNLIEFNNKLFVEIKETKEICQVDGMLFRQ